MKKESLKSASLNDILFDVEMVQIDEFECNSDYAYDIYAYPDGVKKRVNSCSNRYELVPNAEIFPVVRQILLNHGIQFTESYHHINHARFYAQYVIDDTRYAYRINGSTQDVVKPMLKVQHSYNGLTKYMITFGYFRLVCSNGLVIPVEEMKEYNLSIIGKHTESIRKSLERLNETITYFAQNAAQITLAITAKYDTLAGNWVAKWEDRVIEVLNASPVNIVDNSKFSTVNYINSVIKGEVDLYGGRVNDWLIYNAINRYIYDDNLNIKAPEVRREMDSKVFQFMLS